MKGNNKTNIIVIFLLLSIFFILTLFACTFFSYHLGKSGGNVSKVGAVVKDKNEIGNRSNSDDNSDNSDSSDSDSNDDNDGNDGNDGDDSNIYDAQQSQQFVFNTRMNENLNSQYLPRPLNMIPISVQHMYNRDRAVIDDPLYPPLNRNSLQPHDTYRMIGYLVGEESQEDSWQLYGRQINNNKSEFYVRPTNRNIEMKIPIQDSDFRRPSDRLRDIDNLPERTSIDNPLFNSPSYKVVTNPNTNYNSYYF